MSLNNAVQDAVQSAMEDLLAFSGGEDVKADDKPKARKPRASKPKAKAKVETLEDVKATKANPEPKPEPKEIDGFALKDDADVDEVKAVTAEAAEAVEAINRKDADLLSSYLALGKFSSSIVDQFKSRVIFGQYLAKAVPASQTLDPALRSNCKWLYEALNVEGHEAGDLLAILGINRIEDFKSGNPTVIRREYTKLAKANAHKEKLEELGISEEEAEKLEAEKKEKAAKADARKLKAALKRIKEMAMEHPSQEESVDELLGVLESVLGYKKQSEQVEYILSL